MKKLFLMVAMFVLSLVVIAQTNQLVWANGQLLYATPIDKADSLTYDESVEGDTLFLLVPPRLVQTVHDTVYFHKSPSIPISIIPISIYNGYTGSVIILFDPSLGNRSMLKSTKCYAYTGLITSKSTSDSDWKYVTPTWRGSDTKYKMTKKNGFWQLIIPNIYEFYGCPESEKILKLAFVFNDGPNGTQEGKTASGGDIFVDLAY